MSRSEIIEMLIDYELNDISEGNIYNNDGLRDVGLRDDIHLFPENVSLIMFNILTYLLHTLTVVLY